MKIYCNAKLNLSLDITGIRDDRYHYLDMVMQSVDLCDIMTINPIDSDEIEITSNSEILPVDTSNLVCKAAKALAELSGIKRAGLKIHIEKNIPMLAGLGGGSADAAGALLALRKLWQIPISDENLLALGASLGADIPFMLKGGTARVKGIGELINPIAPLGDCYFVIVMPDKGISTKEAFSSIDERTGFIHPSTNRLIESIERGDIHTASKLFCNVFETSGLFPLSTQVKKEMLSYGALGASLTGSGSAVFSLFLNETDAINCLLKLSSKYECFLSKPAGKSIYLENV